MPQVEASEQQLMRELLGLFTPNALAGLAEQHDAPKHSHNPVDIFLCILALQPTDAEAERSITSMRHLALSRLSAALYAAIPADRQVQLLLVSPLLDMGLNPFVDYAFYLYVNICQSSQCLLSW